MAFKGCANSHRELWKLGDDQKQNIPLSVIAYLTGREAVLDASKARVGTRKSHVGIGAHALESGVAQRLASLQ
jgi:hypothetical protein